MRKTWVLTCLAACCAAIAAFISIGGTDEAKVLTVQDALDPTASVIAPYAGSSIERLTPYQLGQRLPGLEGMAFVFSTQARAYQKGSGSLGYAPLYSATAVIAVNRGSDLREPVKGWRTLLSSGAVVLIPHHGTEGGRLAAIALARGLGAREGDLGPATEAFALLQSQGRLNRQDVYRSADYWAMYPPDRLTEHDAIILWDYQAAMLSPDEWEIVVPEEGSLSVDCGFVYGGSLKAREKLLPVRDFLLSDKGRQALADAGFSPPAQPPDLSGWDAARLAYNPGFRRAVLSAKLYGPASVQERLILQSAVLLLFCFAAQRTLRRLPRGIYRTTSLYCLLLVMLWMLVSVLKTISLHYDPSRYLWFSTYLPRHFLPVFWVCMCRINRSGQLPPRKALTALLITAAVLTALVFSNDIHRLVFVYLNTSSSTWASQYTNGWGYYVSSAWSFCLIVAGMALLLHKNRTRQQNRQIVYAFTLFFILLGYQALYIAGVKYVLDFDIPTTVAFFVLVFILAAQRERFMGATLLELPVFKNSPYAISIFDGSGTAVYSNDTMRSLRDSEIVLCPPGHPEEGSAEVLSGERTFKRYEYTLDAGRAVVLEDITYLTRLRLSQKETHEKLKAVRELLIRQAEMTRSLTDRLEQERYSNKMDSLFNNKLEQLRSQLNLMNSAGEDELSDAHLRRARFLLFICQQRLRFIIQSLGVHPHVPAEMIEGYAAGLIKNGRRIGLDGVFTAASRGSCPPATVETLLECIDTLCLFAFDMPASSFIFRMDAHEAGIALNASLSLEGDNSIIDSRMIPEDLVAGVTALNGRIEQEAEEDGLLTRLFFPVQEALL